MIYVENDFYSNFNNAVKANDDVTIQGMLVDEFSTLIAKRRGEMIQLYQKVGIPLSATPSNEELCTALVNNIQANKKFQAGLAYLIAKDNEILAGSEKSNRSEDDESESKEQKEEDYERTSNTITAIAGTIGVLADSLRGERANEFQKELQDKSNTKAPNYSGEAYGKKTDTTQPKKKSKKWLWILGGAVVIGGIYYAYKKGYIGGDKVGSSGGIETPPVATATSVQ